MRLTVPRLTTVLFRWPRRAAARLNGARRRRGRAAVFVLPPAFVLILAAAWGVAESAVPEITDTDYYTRLRLTRAAQAEHPDRPLGVLLGSSRTVWGFSPEQLPEPPAGTPHWVNFSHVGAGPTLNRVLLHRLLRDGVRPAVVALEVMPPFFVRENNRFVSGHFAAADMPVAHPYSDHPLGYYYYFVRHRLARAPELTRVTDPFAGSTPLLPRGGPPAPLGDVTPDERTQRAGYAYQNYRDCFRTMTVRPTADRAFRDTLREAADHGVRVVLLRTPEGPTFRSWYAPDALARFDAYIAGVAAEFGLPVLDARLWLDETDFWDSHHPLARGANKFTARFAREIPAALAGR